MTYAKVVNGEVVEYSSSPKVRHPDRLKEYGWYPVVEIMPDKNEWEEYGTRTEVFDGEQVTWTYPVRSLSLDAFKKRQISSLIEYATAHLKSLQDPVLNMASVYKSLPQSLRDKMDSESAVVVNELLSLRKTISDASSFEEVNVVNINPWSVGGV